MSYQPKKIVSGAQTGADIGGLTGAERAGIPTGGFVPKGFKTEKGFMPPELLDRFNLVEHSDTGYNGRTLENVKTSDATIIFSTSPTSGGTRVTVKYCKQEGKPFILIDPFQNGVNEHLAAFFQLARPEVLNIAGNRESVSPGISARVAKIISEYFQAQPSSPI